MDTKDTTSEMQTEASGTRCEMASVASGNAIVVGLQTSTELQGAGMAFMRVFQGHVQVLGFRLPLGTYHPIFAPKWSSQLSIEAKEHIRSSGDAKQGRHAVDGSYQAPMQEQNLQLLQLTDSTMRISKADNDSYSKLSVQKQRLMEEEYEADTLARTMARRFPVVIILRTIPTTYGNVSCFYEAKNVYDTDLVLPGFKLIRSSTDPVYGDVQQLDDAHSIAPNKQILPGRHDWKSSERLLDELTVRDTVRPVLISEEWAATADVIEQSLVTEAAKDCPQRVLVCGGKGVGKSTFCRYLVNRTLSHFRMIAFIDTDVGQPELTPSGIVSLHLLASPILSSGFIHTQTPFRSYFCGASNPSNDPDKYMRAVSNLIRLYECKWGKHHDGTPDEVIPLVINTDGWVKSMGHDLLCSVIQDASPNHVVQLLATARSKQFDVPTDGQWQVHKVEPWKALAVSQATRSSHDLRRYRLHAHFLARSPCYLPRDDLRNLQWPAEKNRLDRHLRLAYERMVPYAVSFDAIDVTFVGPSVPPSQVLVALNRSIVGLCFQVKRPDTPETHDYKPPRVLIPSDSVPPCLGMGMVRSIDPTNRMMYVLSPLPEHVMQKVNLLVLSRMPLDAFVGVDNASSVYSPYVLDNVLSEEGTGASMMFSRNSIKRRRDDKTG